MLKVVLVPWLERPIQREVSFPRRIAHWVGSIVGVMVVDQLEIRCTQFGLWCSAVLRRARGPGMPPIVPFLLFKHPINDLCFSVFPLLNPLLCSPISHTQEPPPPPVALQHSRTTQKYG